METSGNKKLLIAVGLVLLLVIVALVWYFVYAKPIVAPSLAGTNDPVNPKSFPARFQFLNWTDEKKNQETEVSDPKKDPLIQVWKKPATGQTFVITQTLQEITSTTTEGTSTKIIDVKKTIRATSTALLFVDKTNGYLYRYNLQSGKTTQITNTLIPGIAEAFIFENGSRVIMRYVDTNKNSIVGLIANIPSVPEDGVANPLEAIQYLASDVVSVAVNYQKTSASYVVATKEGSAVYMLVGKVPKLVASSPFREWVISYGGNKLYATTKPSAYVEGVTTSLPNFEMVLDEKTGLMSNPGPGNILLHSMWGKNGLATFFSIDSYLQVLPVTTVASKCAWENINYVVCAVPKILPLGKEGLPDDWFQGRVSFDDDLVIVDVKNNQSSTLYTFNPDKEGVFDIDTISPNDNGDLLGFTNKNDETLWLLNTNNISR